MQPIHTCTPILNGVQSKKIILLLVIAINSAVQAQYYKPFTGTSKKLFTEHPLPDNGHSMAFDTSLAIGVDPVHFHFGALNLGSTMIDPLCQGWGSEYCYRTELPVWSGSLFRTNEQGTYWFRTLNGDSLRFDLGSLL